MKLRLYSTAIAASVLALATLSHRANADTIDVSVLQSTGNAPVEGDMAPVSFSGSFIQGEVGSTANETLSPYASNSNGTQNTPYNVLSFNNAGPGSATYNLSGSSYELLWGSPDTYNTITFYSGADGGGTELGTFNAIALSCFGNGGDCTDAGFALTLFTDTDGSLGSVVLSDQTGAAAFEFGTVTPLPGTFALFLGGLGLLGFAVLRRRANASRGLRLSAV
jgi:hypothetical protein